MNKEKEIETTERYKYFAFISYNSKDNRQAKTLQRTLEWWRLHTSLCKEKELAKRPMRKVFFAPSEIQLNEKLTEELKARLRASRYLIVVCSPNSAKSDWVSQEIEYFIEIGRKENIYFFIIKGEANAQDEEKECFNPAIKNNFDNPLAADINYKVFSLAYLNRQRAYVQLISTLLGLEFDSLWRRHRRRIIEKVCAWVCLALVFVFSLLAVWQMNKPIDISLNLSEKTAHNPNLPPLQDAIVCFEIGENKFFDTISSFEDNIIFPNVASSLIGDTAKLSVKCEDWFPIDTILIASKQINLSLSRDESVYGKYKGLLYSSELDRPLANYPFSVEGIEFITNSEGAFEIIIPLEKQKKEVLLKCDRCLEGLLLNLKMEDGNYEDGNYIDVDYVE